MDAAQSLDRRGVKAPRELQRLAEEDRAVPVVVNMPRQEGQERGQRRVGAALAHQGADARLGLVAPLHQQRLAHVRGVARLEVGDAHQHRSRALRLLGERAHAEAHRGLGDGVAADHEGLLDGDPPALGPRAEIGEHGEAMIEAVLGALGAVAREHFEGRVERPELGRDRPDPELAQAQRLAQRAGRVVLRDRRAEAGDEAPRLGGEVDGDVEVNAPVLHPRRVMAHRLPAEGARAAAELELPVVPFTGEHAVADAPLRERVALMGTAIVERVDRVAVAHANEAVPSPLRSVGFPGSRSARGPISIQ